MKKLWKCTICGYVHEGESAPDVCPKCGAPKEKFIELGSEDAEKIYKSDRTNDIHIEMIEMAAKLNKLCALGMCVGNVRIQM